MEVILGCVHKKVPLAQFSGKGLHCRSPELIGNTSPSVSENGTKPQVWCRSLRKLVWDKEHEPGLLFLREEADPEMRKAAG